MNQRKLQIKLPASLPDKPSAFEGISDEALWKMFRKGDDGAFVFIYRNYIDALFNIGIQYTRNEALVKDCLQDFFVDLREKKHNLGETDNIKLYLFKSFRRRIVAVKQKESRFVFQDALKETFAIEFAIDQKIMNSQFAEHQLQSLKTALEQLSSKERQIIYFYFYQNLSYTEIAEVLNYDHVSSARRSVYKILKKLRDFMPILFLLTTTP